MIVLELPRDQRAGVSSSKLHSDENMKIMHKTLALLHSSGPPQWLSTTVMGSSGSLESLQLS